MVWRYPLAKSLVRAPASKRSDPEVTDEIAQRFTTVSRDLEREELIGTRTAEVDGSEWLALFGGFTAETVSRVDHQRRTDDQHRCCFIEY